MYQAFLQNNKKIFTLCKVQSSDLNKDTIFRFVHISGERPPIFYVLLFLLLPWCEIFVIRVFQTILLYVIGPLKLCYMYQMVLYQKTPRNYRVIALWVWNACNRYFSKTRRDNIIAKLNKTIKLHTIQSKLLKCIAALLGSLLEVCRIQKLTVSSAFPALNSI